MRGRMVEHGRHVLEAAERRANSVNHSTNRKYVLVDDGLLQLGEAQSPEGGLDMGSSLVDASTNIGDFEK